MVDSLLSESDSLRHFLQARVQVDGYGDVTTSELIEAYDAPFPVFGGWAARLEEKIDTLRELVREPE